jgi:molecular chaperone GrpE
MMKKKTQAKEEPVENHNYKPTDNKEYSENQNIINSVDSSDLSSEKDSASGRDTDKVVSEVKIVEEKLAEMQDKYIRLSAEFDNYRKRTLREKMELSKYAEENLLLKIIPLMDDFDRALSHMDTATDCIAMKSGIDLIYGKFQDFFKQNGIKEIVSFNSVFNVDLHEAVAKVSVQDEDKKGKVVDVVQKGYFLQDKVLRFSKVVVGE